MYADRLGAPPRSGTLAALTAAVLLGPAVPGAAAAQPIPTDLTELSLEELMNVEVTSVAKREQRLSDSSAAVYVITEEDIRRSGLQTLPELLLMVPGVQVSRVDANKYAISARGFGARFANKMLVLVDGRSLYTPLFGGVFWEDEDLFLADIERIEVIRGPGATLWGANAVNGVINITTKHAAETHGGYVSLATGNEDAPVLGLRHGGTAGASGHYRAYGKFIDRGSFTDPFGGEGSDEWDALRGGVRLEFVPSENSSFLVQAEAYDMTASQMVELPQLAPPYIEAIEGEIESEGAHLLVRRDRRTTNRSSSVQLYYDRTERSETRFAEQRDSFDVQLEQRRSIAERHELIWGVGYRYTTDDTRGSFVLSFDPVSRSDSLFSAFLQDDIAIGDGRGSLTVGSKFEYNDYTGFEVQPNARLVWRVGEHDTWWGAISRAIRSPSRSFDDVRLAFVAMPEPTSGTTNLIRVTGDRSFESETLLAFEVGYRTFHRNWSLDIAGYYNDYSKLTTSSMGTPFVETDPLPHLVTPFYFGNEIDGHAVGAEVVLNCAPTNRWRLLSSYTWLDLDLDFEPGLLLLSDEGESPSNQIKLRSYFELTKSLELDGAVYWIDDIVATTGTGSIPIDSFTRLDLRLSWRPIEDLELAVGGQNLLDGSHLEFVDALSVSTEVDRSLYAQLNWRF